MGFGTRGRMVVLSKRHDSSLPAHSLPAQRCRHLFAVR